MADTTSPNDPAFPAVETHGDGVQQIKHHLGLTVRQWGAFKIAQGIVASPDTADLSFDEVSDRAIKQADSLFAKLGE